MNSAQSTEHVSARLKYERISVPFDGLASELASRKVTSNRIVMLSEEDKTGQFFLGYLAGAWDGNPFRVSIPMRRTGHLRSIVRLWGHFFAVEATLPDSRPTPQMLHAIRALTSITNEVGNRFDDVHFVSNVDGPNCQFIFDLNQSACIELWSPGKVGITSVRLNRPQSTLIGVYTDAYGRGTHLVAISLQQALQNPLHLADPKNWMRLVPDEHARMSIVALSRPKTTPTFMQLCATLACTDEPRKLFAKRIFLQGDLFSEDLVVLQDARFSTTFVTLGLLPGNEQVWIAYESVGVHTDGADMHVMLRAEIPENPAHPFESPE